MTQGEKKKTKRTWKTLLKWTLLLGVLLAALLFLLACAAVFSSDVWNAFDPGRILNVDETLILYDADNAEAARLHGTQDRVSVAIETLPAHVKYAFISAEDARFYEHKGVDVIRILGAAWEDIKAGGYVQGASTISQQLIKLSHLSAEKTIERKLDEAVLAFRLEQAYSKEEILEMYLNYVYFGGGYYGVEAAALGYFGVPARELSVGQAAMLAGILKSPSHYAPHLDMEASLRRRNLVLGLMCEYGYIDAGTRDQARASRPRIVHTGAAARGYYVDAALKEAAALLEISVEELLRGGYRVYTGLDAALQSQCESLFCDETLFPAPDAQAAIVVQRANSPFLAALVGGRGTSAALSFNRATDIRRQPGSVIKPVLCYAPALEQKGYTAATTLLDAKETFGDYTPNNFGARYYGWVTLRQAVTKSLNVPAVKVFADVGVENAKAFAEKLGVRFDERDQSLALALGGFTYGVSPQMIAGAYNCFASGGVYYAPTAIRGITDKNGRALYAASEAGTRVMRAENAYILTSMLRSVVTDGTGKRLALPGIDLAGKTGTVGESAGNRDAWMAAYNPDYTAAVWMGYDSAAAGSLPDAATGGKYPALLLGAVFSYLYREAEAPDFAAPENVVEVRLDGYTLQSRHTAVLATALTPAKSVTTEVFAAGTEPAAASEYWTVPLPAGSLSATAGPDGYPQIAFTPRQSHILYRLYRRDDNGETQCVGEWTGTTARIKYTDTNVQAGMGYTYSVEALHPELLLNGRPVAGPAAGSGRIAVSSLANAHKRTDVLDLTGIGGGEAGVPKN